MRYTHDCPYCVGLKEYEEYDLYFCPLEWTPIARYGSDGNYMSGMAFKYVNTPLGVAVALWEQRLYERIWEAIMEGKEIPWEDKILKYHPDLIDQVQQDIFEKENDL